MAVIQVKQLRDHSQFITGGGGKVFFGGGDSDFAIHQGEGHSDFVNLLRGCPDFAE